MVEIPIYRKSWMLVLPEKRPRKETRAMSDGLLCRQQFELSGYSTTNTLAEATPSKKELDVTWEEMIVEHSGKGANSRYEKQGSECLGPATNLMDYGRREDGRQADEARHEDGDRHEGGDEQAQEGRQRTQAQGDQCYRNLQSDNFSEMRGNSKQAKSPVTSKQKL